MNRMQVRTLSAALALALGANVTAAPVPNGFRVYGFVTRGGAPFNGTVDLQIQLFDAAGGAGTIGPVVTLEDLPVAGGNLVTFVDFGGQNPFIDMDTYLGGGVRLGTSSSAFNSFTTRARFSPTGFALHAQKVAPATVGSNEIRSAEVQRRIGAACPDGEAMKSVGADGSVVCAPLGTGGGGGDISGVAAGTALAGGGDSGSVTLSVANLGIGPAQLADDAVNATKIASGAVGADEISTDAVTADEIAANAVASAEIAPNTITQFDADTTGPNGLQRRLAGSCPAGQAIGAVASDGALTCNTASAGWTLTGNTGTSPPLNFIGTTDDQFFDIRTNNRRAMRFRSLDDPNGSAYGGPVGAPAVIGGASANEASGPGAAIGGGGNTETGNSAAGRYATVPGGHDNHAGGDYSFAAGRKALVRSASQVGGGDTNGDEGTFVWSDSQLTSFVSNGADRFLVRARNGVGINTADPRAPLHVREGASATPFAGTIGGTKVLIEDDVTTYLTLAAPASAATGIGFQSGNIATAGRLTYNNPSNANGFDFAINGITAMRLFANNQMQVPPVLLSSGASLTIQDSTSINGNLTVAGTITASNCCAAPSDARLKQDIAPLEASLEHVLALRGVRYAFTDSARAKYQLPGGEQLGFIAQELEREFPQWVRDDERGFKTVFLRPFDALMVEALRDLRNRHVAELAALQTRFDQLAQENGRLRQEFEDRLAHLERAGEVQVATNR